MDILWIDPESNRKPYGHIKPGDEMRQQTFAGHVWLVTDAMGGTLAVFEAETDPVELVIDGKSNVREQKGGRERLQDRGVSPDGRWAAGIENHNIVLRQIATGETMTLTKDGTAEGEYRGPATWAPDSQSFVVANVDEVTPRQVNVIESSPPDQLQPKLISYPYPKPGDPLPQSRPVLVRVADRSVHLIDNTLFSTPFSEGSEMNVRWSPRGDEFYFDYNQRGHQLYRIIGVKAATRDARIVVEEKSDTFVDYTQKTWRAWLDKTGELLWMSERDGWCRLYLYDAVTGALKAQVTGGQGIVRKVEKVDEEKREVWFLASGLRAGEDPTICTCAGSDSTALA